MTVVLALFLLIGSGCTPSESTRLSGEKLYMLQCASCHQGNGAGLPGIYPPLAGSPWVTGDEERLILTVLHGLKGPLTVHGQVYEGLMPAHERRLRPEDLTAILNFIRTSWGNRADSISVEQVQALAASVTRNTPWTVEELEAHIRTGVTTSASK